MVSARKCGNQYHAPEQSRNTSRISAENNSTKESENQGEDKEQQFTNIQKKRIDLLNGFRVWILALTNSQIHLRKVFSYTPATPA